jgi:hypothetical protein
VTRARVIDPAADAVVAALVRRLLAAVDRGDLAAEDVAGRCMVALWSVLAEGKDEPTLALTSARPAPNP